MRGRTMKTRSTLSELAVALLTVAFWHGRLISTCSAQDFTLVKTFDANSMTASWCDYDDDGDQDLFVGYYRGGNGILYTNDGNGAFTAIQTFDHGSGSIHSSSWGDFNNDGRPDLFIVVLGGTNQLWKNDGGGLFTKVSPSAFDSDAAAFASAAWGDYDQDGFLDLFVSTGIYEAPQTNFLYRNLGNGTFLRVTTGPVAADTSSSYGCSWADYDNDGDLDLFVANHNNQNNFLYRNDGNGQFTKITAGPVVNDGGYSTGATWGDYDNDGDLDLFVSNVGSNFLYRNEGNGTFTKVTTGPIVEESAPFMGSSWVDFDNDGDLDLFVVGDPNTSRLYRNDGGGVFTSATNIAIANLSGHLRGVCWADYDNDGFMDVFVGRDAPPTFSDAGALFRNLGNSNHWLKVRCIGTNSNRSAIGAKVRVMARIGGVEVWQLREITAQNGYAGHDAQIAHFGLGDATMVDVIRIEWPLGRFEEISHWPANRLLTVQEGQGDPRVGTRYYYDRNDRLVGAEYDRGISLAYVYDGNGNLIRQTWLSRDPETYGLPVLWRFFNGLSPTDNSGTNATFADADGDGWSNYQEWKVGSSPTNAASVPDVRGLPGTNTTSLAWPFTPSNFVVGVGELDGTSAEEIVIGADGNPSTNTNFLLVLSETTSGWTTQRVDIGAVGITSIGIDQPSNTTSAAIYIGTRQTSGTGTVMEVKLVSNVWQKTALSIGNTGQVAYVLGVRSNNDILVHLSPTNAPDQSLSSVSFSNAVWSSRLLDTNTSHRGLGTVALTDASSSDARSLRLSDNGGIHVGLSTFPRPRPVPTAISNSTYGAWYFLTDTQMYWTNAQAKAREFGGNLVTIEGTNKNSWIRSNFAPSSFWIGLYSPSANYSTDGITGWEWASGSSSTFRAWEPTQPDSAPSGEPYAEMRGAGLWNNNSPDQTRIGLVEVPFALVPIVLPEPSATRTNNWRGHSLASGFTRQTNGVSVFYTFTDDKNLSQRLDAGDDFVVTEFLVAGTSATVLSSNRIELSAATLSQSYGLASVNLLNSSNEVFFTAEPDGQIFSWVATNNSGPLQRQLFSGYHEGKAWHALAGVKTLEPGEGLIGLRVDPTNQNRCDVIFWPPQPQLPQLPNVPQSAPVAVVLPSTNTLTSMASVTNPLWDAEGNDSTPYLQFEVAGTTNWSDAAVVSVDGMPYSVNTRVAASPAGINHTIVWNALTDLGPNVTTNVLLRVRARDITLLGEWSPGTPFLISTVTTPDTDNDGLPDSWEIQYFGSTAANPNADPDGDGLKNWQEYIADTNPTNTASHLTLSVSLLSGGVKLDWLAGSNSWKFLQSTMSLTGTNAPWFNIWTSPAPPSPDSGSYTDSFGTDATKFYRLKATR